MESRYYLICQSIWNSLGEDLEVELPIYLQIQGLVRVNLVAAGITNRKPKGLYTIASYILVMATTIQVSEKLLDTLKRRKQYDKESYEEVIRNLIEDTIEINEETKKEIEQARTDIKSGKFYTHEQVKKKLGF